MTEAEHLQCTRDLLNQIGNQEVSRLFSYECCECDSSFVAFLESYWDLKEIIPKDFTVIDFGCYQAFQGALFREHEKYIGVDCGISSLWRLQQSNAIYFECSIQEFIQDILPKENLNLEKVFAICSYVPDDEARKMIRDTFPYFRDRYCNEVTEKIPVISKNVCLDFS